MHNVDVRNISLGELLYFVKVVEYGSFTKAAEFFHLTQPTLSKKMASLEAQTGIQLFIREKNKGLRLTPAGRHLYGQWKELPRKIEGSLQTAHAIQAGYNKSLIVAGLDSFRPEDFILPVVERFWEEYPDVQLRIESNSVPRVREMLIAGEADVVFSVHYDFEEREFSHVKWRLFDRLPNCVYMLKTNPLSHRSSLRLDELRQSRFVCITPQELPSYLDMIRRLCARAGFIPNISKYVSSAASLTLNITADDELFICDPHYWAAEDKRLCQVPLEDTRSGFVMAWRTDSGNPFLEPFLQSGIRRLEELNMV